jgi:hypothetical protein
MQEEHINGMDLEHMIIGQLQLSMMKIFKLEIE